MFDIKGILVLRKLFIALSVLVTATSCQLFWSPKSPRGYVVPRPNKMILDKKLNEISGIFYLPQENSFIAIADDKQKVYRVTVDGKVSNYFEHDFGAEADYEDIVKVDSSVFVLISDGTILDVKRRDTNFVKTTYTFPTTDS